MNNARIIRPTHALAAFVALCAAIASAATPSTRPATTQLATTQPAIKKAAATKTFFSGDLVPTLRIDITGKELEALRKDPRTYVRGNIRESLPGQGDILYSDVALRLKGAAGSFRGVDDRPAFTANFGRHRKGQLFHGLEKLSLNNSVQDPSYLCEQLSRNLFREAGLPAARAAHARVIFNQRDLGLYVLLEGLDRDFLDRNFKSQDGVLYEGSFIEIDANLKRVVDGPRPRPASAPGAAPAPAPKPPANDPASLQRLVAAAREPDLALRRKKLAELIDIERFLDFMALEAMIVHWDGYGGNKNNYRIYYDPGTQRFNFIPHGMDQVFQQPGYAHLLNGTILTRAVTESPEDRQRYYERMAHLRKTVFDPQKLCAQVDRASDRIAPVLKEINPDLARQQRDHANGLKQRIVERARAIDQHLASLPRPLKFDETGAYALDRWAPNQQGAPALIEAADVAGRKAMRIRVGAGEAIASIRTTLALPQGKYTFEGECRTAGVVAPDGPNTGAGLRISGSARTTRLVGDTDWKKTQYDFEITEPARDVVFVCELRASKGEALFDLHSLKLRKRN